MLPAACPAASRRAAGSDQEHSRSDEAQPRPLARLHEPAAIGVHAEQSALLDHNSVHGPRYPGRLVQVVKQREDRLFMRHGHVEAPETEGPETAYGRGEVLGSHVHRDVDVIQARGRKGGVVHLRAQGVADGVPNHPDQSRPCARVHPSGGGFAILAVLASGLGLGLQELVVGAGEDVLLAIGLQHVVEVIGLSGVYRGLEGLAAGAAYRSRR